MIRAFWLCAAFALGGVACAFVGCGSSSAPPATADAAAPAPAAAAAPEPAPFVDNRPPGERLAGDWVGSLVADPEGVKDLTPQQLAAAQQARLGIGFEPDGQMIEWDHNRENDDSVYVPGSWVLLKHEGDNITIRSTSTNGKQKDIVILFEGPDSFLMPLKTEVANLGAMRFERLR